MSIFKQDSDHNFLSFYENGLRSDGAYAPLDGGRYLVQDETFAPESPERYDDIVRLHKAKGYLFNRVRIDGRGANKEDALDLNNRCIDNVFVDCVFESGRNGALTVKGGSSLNFFTNCTVRGRGKIVDVELGNHSDQSREKCVDNKFVRLRHEDGKPVRVAWGCWSERPKLVECNVEVVWWYVVVLHLYTWAKRLLPFIP